MSMQKAPLDPGAGSVPVPEGQSSQPAPHNEKSIGHDVNSAHDKSAQPSDIDRSASPGMATGHDSASHQPPNWQNQDAILDAASHGNAVNHETSHANVSKLKREQHVGTNDGETGPTGLSIGKRNMEEEGTSKHDKMQQDLLDGKPSRDGEGSAGLPFDAGN